MKEEEDSPIRIKESYGKKQISQHDFLKSHNDQQEQEISISKNRLNQAQQKELNILRQQEKVRSPSKQVQDQPKFHQHSSNQVSMSNKMCSDGLKNNIFQENDSNFIKCLKEILKRMIGLAILENPCKEIIQPYWRNKLLLFITLIFLIIENFLHLFNNQQNDQEQSNEDNSIINMFRIIIITLFTTFLTFSLVILYFRNKNYPTSSLSKITIFSSCFSDSHYLVKLLSQILITFMCVFILILYAKCISSSLSYQSKSSEFIIQSFSLQIIEMLLFYSYASTFFLSFYFLKITFLLSTFLIIFFMLGFQSNPNNYYYVIILIIFLLQEYQNIQISIEMHKNQKNKLISQNSFPSEQKSNKKSPYHSPLQNNYNNSDINKKQFNSIQFQNQMLQSDTQRYSNSPQFSKTNQKTSINIYDENFYKLPSIEGVMTQTQNTEFNELLLKQVPNLQMTKKSSQKMLETIGENSVNNEYNGLLNKQINNSSKIKKSSQKTNINNEQNLITLLTQTDRKISGRIENYLFNDSNEITNFRSEKKTSGGSKSIKSSKTRNNSETAKIINESSNHDNVNENSMTLNEVQQIKICSSEPSQESSKEISYRSSSSSQNISNLNRTSSQFSDISPVTRLQRNFSLFKRQQDLNQSQIEEKTSQEEMETYGFLPMKLQKNKLEMFAFQRSNSLGRLSSNQIPISQRASQIYSSGSRKNNSPLKQNQRFMYSNTERSQDEDFSNQFNSRETWLFNNESKVNLSNKFSIKQFQISRQGSIDNKKDKLNGISQTPVGINKTQTSSNFMTTHTNQKTKLYKNILKYLPDEGVVLIDRNKNIHFANLHMQQLFPRSNQSTLFNELVQLKSIETLEDYNQYLNEILEQKNNLGNKLNQNQEVNKIQDTNQNQDAIQNQDNNYLKVQNGNHNISQNFTKVQLTDSITCHSNNQESIISPYWVQQQPPQQQQNILQNTLPNIFKQSRNSDKNIPQTSSSPHGQSASNKNKEINSDQTNNNYNQSNQTNTHNQQHTSNQINLSSNQNIPIGYHSLFQQPFTSSASINPTQRLSQSNYFMKLDLFKQAKENIQLKETFIKCQSFPEQFEQIFKNFQQSQKQYQQYGIASQNKFTTLLYRPLINQKQESIEDVQIFEVQFIPCYLGYTEGVVVTMRDVTHFNQIKVLKDINEKKSNILRNVSHELRQPLNCIISMMQLTRDSYTDQTLLSEYINPTLYSCQILLNLLNDFLDFSQIQAGTFKLTNVYFNIKKLFQNIFQMMKAQIQIRSLNFVLNIVNENDISEEIKSDPHRVQQIITNLLGNAVKFTEQGDIVLTLEKIQPNIYKISVTDSGIGITDEGQKKLFKTFGKVDQERKPNINPQGVGLGLMISNILAQQLGPVEDRGLQVESKIGCGTKFFFYLSDKTCQDKEIISFTPFSDSREKQVSPINMQKIFPNVRRATSRNMEASILHQVQPLETYEDCLNNSVQIVFTPRNMITRQQYLNQICNYNPNTSQSFDSIQEQINQIDLNSQIQVNNKLHNVHENNIQKIDQKNIHSQNNHNIININNNNTQLQDNNQQIQQKISYNIIISTKHLDVNFETGYQRDIKRQNSTIKKNQQQQSQIITQGMALRQQTLILQQDSSPRGQKQLIDEIINYQKQKQLKCQQCNTKDILIVDDNDFNIYVLDKYIKSFHLDADSSTNGPSSEKKVKDKFENSQCQDCKVYKIIFMDINLGQQCGIVTTNNIIQIYSQYQISPPSIIACTGLVDEDTVQNCLVNGFSDFLVKPINKDQLVEIIHKYLKIEQ